MYFFVWRYTGPDIPVYDIYNVAIADFPLHKLQCRWGEWQGVGRRPKEGAWSGGSHCLILSCLEELVVMPVVATRGSNNFLDLAVSMLSSSHVLSSFRAEYFPCGNAIVGHQGQHIMQVNMAGDNAVEMIDKRQQWLWPRPPPLAPVPARPPAKVAPAPALRQAPGLRRSSTARRSGPGAPLASYRATQG